MALPYTPFYNPQLCSPFSLYFNSLILNTQGHANNDKEFSNFLLASVLATGINTDQ